MTTGLAAVPVEEVTSDRTLKELFQNATKRQLLMEMWSVTDLAAAGEILKKLGLGPKGDVLPAGSPSTPIRPLTAADLSRTQGQGGEPPPGGSAAVTAAVAVSLPIIAASPKAASSCGDSSLELGGQLTKRLRKAITESKSFALTNEEVAKMRSKIELESLLESVWQVTTAEELKEVQDAIKDGVEVLKTFRANSIKKLKTMQSHRARELSKSANQSKQSEAKKALAAAAEANLKAKQAAAQVKTADAAIPSFFTVAWPELEVTQDLVLEQEDFPW